MSKFLTCNSCTHWFPHHGPDQGECRFNAPVGICVHNPDPDEHRPVFLWPLTDALAGCGQHKPLEEPAGK